MTHHKILFRVLVFFTLVAFFFVPTATAAKTIKLAHVNAPKHPTNLGALKFKELVEAKSKGEIKVKVYPAAQLGNVDVQLAAVKTGEIQAAFSTYPKMGDLVKDFAILTAGYVFRDFQHQRAVFNSSLGKSWEKVLIQNGGLRVLSSIYYGVRHLTTTKKAIYHPRDLKGLKIRSVTNPMSQTVVKGLGATPTPIPFPELFNALRQGVVDGQENPLSVIWNKKLYELQKYLMLTGHQVVSLPLIMNNEFFKSLSPNQQKIVKGAAQEACTYGSKKAVDAENSLLENVKGKGVNVISEKNGLDQEAFRKSVIKAVRERFEAKLGKELFEKVAKY